MYGGYSGSQLDWGNEPEPPEPPKTSSFREDVGCLFGIAVVIFGLVVVLPYCHKRDIEQCMPQIERNYGKTYDVLRHKALTENWSLEKFLRTMANDHTRSLAELKREYCSEPE
jgi:hypothetical protein